ncbi:hypothetical protein [Kitasatospora sp. NPDC088779]|uniref:hypothetical protein n=1 Tax=Kitasatospora sp. NPDC088779 TaxID=3154964 RepID=UPI0034360543
MTTSVRARLWKFSVQADPDGISDIVAVEVGQGHLPVALSRLIHINALACDLRKIIDPRVRDHEVALLLSYITAGAPGTLLTAKHKTLLASSGHISRFVAEATGLGVMTAASECLFAWSPADGLHSFDVLPGQLVKQYGGGGVRPDLLFHVAGGPLAGEARGRRRRAKQLFPETATAGQRGRLLQLAAWSAAHAGHAYFMSWVWIGPAGVGVDIFLPASDSVDSALDLTWIDEPGHAVWEIRAERRRASARAEAPAEEPWVEDLDWDEPRSRAEIRPVRSDKALFGKKVLSPEDLMDAALARRFEMTGDVEGEIGGVLMRGRWVSADRLGPATHEVLLGVLADRLPDRTTRRGHIARHAQSLDTHLDGRMLTVVRRVDEDRPSWDRITADLLEPS